MKKKILHSTLAILMMIGCLNLHAQCPDDNALYLTVTLSSPQGVTQPISSCTYGGEYNLINVTPEITYRFSTCGDTDFDTELTVYDVTTGTMLGHNNDACGLQSEVDITVPVGTTQLRVLLDQVGCTAITTCMTMTATRLSPDNDLCTEAISLPGDGTYSGSTIMASENLPLGGGACVGDADSQDDGVWYTFIGDGADWLFEFPAVAGWDPEVNVYTGACGAYVCETGNDDAGPGVSAEFTVNSVSGTQYWVYVHDCCDGNSDFTFDVTVIPTCDIVGTVASTNVICPGGADGTITVTATSSNPITYEISGTAAQTNTTGSFTGLSAGAYVVSYYDTGDMTCNGTENITIADGIDNEAPTITCGGDESVTTSGDGVTGDCFYADFLGFYTIDDNCASGGTLSVNEVFTDENGIIFKNETYNLTASTWGPYADWPTGVNTAVITVTDGSGLTASCSYQVTVIDDEAPVLDCPDDIAVNTDSGVCGAIVNYDLPTATDNCAAPSSLPGFTLIGTHDGSTYFLSNGSTNGATATLNAGNVGGHLATITSASENAFLSANAGSYRIIGLNDVDQEGNFVWVTGEPVTFTDWYGGEPNNLGNEDYVVMNFGGGWNDIPSFTQARYIVEFDALPIEAEFVSGIESGGLFPVGTTTVAYTATDESGNTTNCSFDVTVTDNEAPVIVCTPHVSKFALEGLCGDYITLFDPIVLSENCGVASITSDAPADEYYPVGTHIVTFSVEDVNGNVTTCETEVKVTDFEKPVIDCQQVVNVWLEPNQCSVFVPIPAATATDNCGIASLVNDSPGTFTAGNTFVLWQATDIHGNISYCETEVRVKDTTDPVITSCPQNITVEANPNLNGGAYVDFAATATDNCGITTIHYSQNPNTIFPIGTTIVLVDATDTQGNHDYCEFTVTVTPIFSIECPDDIVTTVADDLEGAFVLWNEPALMLGDDCDCAEEEINGFDYLGDFGNSQYYLYNVEKVEWADALLKAQLAGGHLVTIGSAPENQWVADAITPFNLEEGAWMGLNDLETETINEWVTGEPLTYENFHAGMPDNTFLEDVYLFRNSGEWEDKPVGFPFFFIMEIDCIHIDQTNDVNADNGGFFPIGTTTVTYTVSDNCGNMDNCSFDITVESNSTMPIVDPCQIAGAEGLHIESFRAGDYENVSGDNDGYADFAMEPIQIGETTEIQLTPGGQYADGKAFWTVWMDMNNDGDYYDNEVLYQAEAEGVHNATFDMPTNADLTSVTHTMRIALSRDHFVAPCGDFGAGEVEDYRVAVVSEIVSNGCYLEFLGFEGSKEVAGNELNWVSQSDCKVDYYMVQHSFDGVNFENIKKLDANNIADLSAYYTWTHDDAFNGINYYRIAAKTVELEDFYTQVIEIKSIEVGKATIYPNPANDKANLDVSAYAGKAATLSIYNVLGQQMWTAKYDALPSTAIRLDLNDYEDQTMFVAIQIEGYRLITLPLVVDRVNLNGARR